MFATPMRFFCMHFYREMGRLPRPAATGLGSRRFGAFMSGNDQILRQRLADAFSGVTFANPDRFFMAKGVQIDLNGNALLAGAR